MALDLHRSSSEEELNYGTESDSDEVQPLIITDVRTEANPTGLIKDVFQDVNNNDMSGNKTLKTFSPMPISVKDVNSNNLIKTSASRHDFSDIESSNATLDSESLSGDTDSSLYSEEELYTQSQMQDVVFWVLTQVEKRFGKFKKSEIYVVGGLKGKSRDTQAKFINEIRQKLSWVFGFHMKESSRLKGTLFLVNTLQFPMKIRDSEQRYFKPNEDKRRQIDMFESNSELDRKRKSQYGLLFAILGLIYMSPGHTVSDSSLDTFLLKMGLMKDKKSGREMNAQTISLFSKSPKDVLIKKEWVNAKYIQMVTINNGMAGKVIEYKWGERAELEVDKSDILSHVAQVYGVKEQAFREQYSELHSKG